MRVTFVYPDVRGNEFCPDYPGSYYNGIASLSAVVKQAGHHCALVQVTSPDIRKEEFLARVEETSPDLIAFSATTLSFPLVAKTAAWLSEARSSTPTLVGGVHAILNPEEVLNTTGIDLVCLGEGEQVIVDVCSALVDGRGFGDIAGLGMRDGEGVQLNRPCCRVDDLDELPFPDRSLFDYPRLFDERSGIAIMMASRGCPYNCRYCCNQALREAMGNRKPVIRFHSVDYVIREAKQLLEEYDFITEIRFDDDILFLDETWAKEFTERYPSEVGIPFTSNMRPNLATESIISMLAESGCKEIRIGLESGNDSIRNDVLGRNISREQIIDAVKLAQRHGMMVHTFNIFGLPFETPHTALDTIRLNAEAGPDEWTGSIFCPFPGTRLHALSEENGFLRELPKAYDFYTEAVLEQPTISRRQVTMFRRWFRQLVKMFRFLNRLPSGFRRPLTSVVVATLAAPASNFAADMVLRAIHTPYMGVKRFWLGSMRKSAQHAGA